MITILILSGLLTAPFFMEFSGKIFSLQNKFINRHVMVKDSAKSACGQINVNLYATAQLDNFMLADVLKCSHFKFDVYN